jgi:prepilin-type N-terminal cleavage/methylation domain-containing protein/prepilin-type processing-associated H-X9-DG protein
MKNFQTCSGFSLIEILCVTAITATLAAVAVGSIGPMIDQSKSVECLSNMRQVGAAVHLYLGENHGRLPSSSHDRAPDGSSLSWTNTLAAYLGADFIGRCPDQKNHPARITYGWNDLLTDMSGAGISAVACRQPGSTIALAELAPDQISEHMHFRGSLRNGRLTANQFRGYVNTTCHGRGANYLFVDGRVENLPWTDVQRRVTSQNSIFINP